MKSPSKQRGGRPLKGDSRGPCTCLPKAICRAKEFDLTGTTIGWTISSTEQLSQKKQEKLNAWFCDGRIGGGGTVIFGKPMTARGRVGAENARHTSTCGHVERPWCHVQGPFPDAEHQGYRRCDGRELRQRDTSRWTTSISWATVSRFLGGSTVRNKKTNGRILVDYSILTAGIALDEGKAKIHLAKPRKWFEEQQNPQPERVESTASPTHDGWIDTGTPHRCGASGWELLLLSPLELTVFLIINCIPSPEERAWFVRTVVPRLEEVAGQASQVVRPR